MGRESSTLVEHPSSNQLVCVIKRRGWYCWWGWTRAWWCSRWSRSPRSPSHKPARSSCTLHHKINSQYIISEKKGRMTQGSEDESDRLPFLSGLAHLLKKLTESLENSCICCTMVLFLSSLRALAADDILILYRLYYYIPLIIIKTSFPHSPLHSPGSTCICHCCSSMRHACLPR